MIHTNPDNPINWSFILTPGEVRRMNRRHKDMLVNIEQAFPSTALQQVSVAQYASAVSDLRRAFEKVRGLQLTRMDMAHDNLPDLETLGLPEQP